MKPTITLMSNSDDNYIGVLLEQIRDQNQAVLEGMKDLSTRREFNELRQDVAELKQDMKIVKAAVADLSRQVNDHERRIGDLEAARS